MVKPAYRCSSTLGAWRVTAGTAGVTGVVRSTNSSPTAGTSSPGIQAMSTPTQFAIGP